jgi:hypothetical protein
MEIGEKEENRGNRGKKIKGVLSLPSLFIFLFFDLIKAYTVVNHLRS